MKLAWPHPYALLPWGKWACAGCVQAVQTLSIAMGQNGILLDAHGRYLYHVNTEKKIGLNDSTHGPTSSEQPLWEEWAELSSPGASSYQLVFT